MINGMQKGIAAILLSVTATVHTAEFRREVTVQLVGSGPSSDQYVFELNNASGEYVNYIHWTGKGPEPLLLVETYEGGLVKTIDQKSLVPEDAILPTHGYRIRSGERVIFKVSAHSLIRVGVECSTDDGVDYTVWSEALQSEAQHGAQPEVPEKRAHSG
jgi:hypothetical protein